jgi:hypothetical protein
VIVLLPANLSGCVSPLKVLRRRDLGGNLRFSGRVSTVKCFENNPLVRKVCYAPHHTAHHAHTHALLHAKGEALMLASLLCQLPAALDLTVSVLPSYTALAVILQGNDELAAIPLKPVLMPCFNCDWTCRRIGCAHVMGWHSVMMGI